MEAFIHIIANPKAVTTENPNGVQMSSNLPEMMVISLLGETLYLHGKGLQAKYGKKVSNSVVMPDGTPAPLPEMANEKS